MEQLSKTLELLLPPRPHHTELPGGIINDFLTSEECLLAQLEWAHKRYMEVIDDREAYERYEKINHQCQGRDYGIKTMRKAFKDIGLDHDTEHEKHFRYWIPYTKYLVAEKAYKDFLVREGRAYLSVVYKPVIED